MQIKGQLNSDIIKKKEGKRNRDGSLSLDGISDDGKEKV